MIAFDRTSDIKLELLVDFVDRRLLGRKIPNRNELEAELTSESACRPAEKIIKIEYKSLSRDVRRVVYESQQTSSNNDKPSNKRKISSSNEIREEFMNGSNLTDSLKASSFRNFPQMCKPITQTADLTQSSLPCIKTTIDIAKQQGQPPSSRGHIIFEPNFITKNIARVVHDANKRILRSRPTLYANNLGAQEDDIWLNFGKLLISLSEAFQDATIYVLRIVKYICIVSALNKLMIYFVIADSS